MISKLLGDRVLFKKPDIPKEDEQMTESGLFVPNSKKKRIYWEAEVEFVGSGVEENIKAGDKIIYIIGTASDIDIDGKNYQFVSSKGIIAVK